MVTISAMLRGVMLLLLLSSTLFAQAARPDAFEPARPSLYCQIWERVVDSTDRWTFEVELRSLFFNTLDFDRDDPILISITANAIKRESLDMSAWNDFGKRGPVLLVRHLHDPKSSVTIGPLSEYQWAAASELDDTDRSQWSAAYEFDAASACKSLPDGPYELCVRWPRDQYHPNLTALPIPFHLGTTTLANARRTAAPIEENSDPQARLTLDEKQDDPAGLRATLTNLGKDPIRIQVWTSQSDFANPVDAGDTVWSLWDNASKVFKPLGWQKGPRTFCPSGSGSVDIQPNHSARVRLDAAGAGHEIWQTWIRYSRGNTTHHINTGILEFSPSKK